MRRAFSLIELLIVVLIIGVIYTLAVNNLSKIEEHKEHITLANLKLFLQKIPHDKAVDFVCIRECTRCYVFADGEKLEEYDKVFDNLLDSSVESYFYTPRNGFELVNEKVLFIDENNYENVCFSYHIDAASKGEELFVLYNQRVYDFSRAFNTKVYKSLDELDSALRDFEMEVKR